MAKVGGENSENIDRKNDEWPSVHQKLNGGGEVISLDVDGPLTDHGASTSLEGRSQAEIASAIGGLVETGCEVVLNSGKPRAYLENFLDELAEYDQRLQEVDVIGGMGTEFRIDGRRHEIEGDREAMLETQRDIYRLAAEERWKLNIQNNHSDAVCVNRVEAEEETSKNPTYCGEKTTDDLWEEYLEDADGFEYVEGNDEQPAISFDVERGADRLMRLQRQEEDFIGLRFEKKEGDILFYRDSEDREVDYDEVFGRLEQIVERQDMGWQYDNYSDGGFEIWNPEYCGKDFGLDAFRFYRGLGWRNTMHHGDSINSDNINIKNSVVVPQAGTPAEDIEQDRTRPYKDAVEVAEEIREAHTL